MRSSFSLALAALVVALCAPSVARASDYADSLDEFSAHVGPPGFIVCTTYPVTRWDGADCEGLSKDFEAAKRAEIGADAVLLGSGVYRADSWGFRVLVTRLPWTVPEWNDAEEARAIERVKADVGAQAAKSKIVVAPGGVDASLVTVGEVHTVRVAYDTLGDVPVSVVDLSVLGEHATYDIEFVGEKTHGKELAAIADRVVQTVHVRPAARRPPLLPSLAIIVLGLVAGVGTLALFGFLAQGRRKERTSAVSWPGTRD